MQVQSLNIAWCLNVGLLRTRITTKGSHQHRAAISFDLGVRYACRPTQLYRGRTPAVRPAHYRHVRTQLRSLRINIHVCYLTLVPFLHQSSTSTNASAKSNILPHRLLPSFHFHQLDIRKILHLQFHLPSIHGHDALSLRSAIYYWCGQKTPQPTW